MNSEKVKIGKSKLHGRGVIALRDIRKGEKIFDIQGKKIKFLIDTQKKADAITYNLVGIDKNTWIHPVKFGLYYNHSCKPNSILKNKNKVIALREIKKGEEVTSDYTLSEADIFWHFKCNCGEKNCRKTVYSIQFLPKPTFRKYENYIQPYYKKVFNKFNRQNFRNQKDLEVAWLGFIRKGFKV